MTTTANPADQLRSVIAAGGISEDALHAMTGIASETLALFLSPGAAETPGLSTNPPVLAGNDSVRVSLLAALLADGMQIDTDERLKGILESLTIECRLTPGNIARLTGVGVEDVELALNDPHAVPLDKRYALAIKSSFLITAVNQARRQ